MVGVTVCCPVVVMAAAEVVTLPVANAPAVAVNVTFRP